MAVKYVKDFEFSKDAGFSSSCGPMKKARGGDVRRPLSRMMREERKAMPVRRMMAEAAQRRQMADRPVEAERPMMRRPTTPMRPNMPELDISPEEIREYSRGRTFAPEAMMKKGGSVRGKKIAKVMREYKKGELHSGSKKGPKVTNPKQAMAIALSEARKMKKAKGGEVKKPAPKKEESKKPKMKTEDLALKKMRHAEKYAPGMDLDNIHSYELSQEAKKEQKVEQYAKGGEVKKAVHKHEKAMHPGKPLTKLKKGGLPVHKGSPMYGRK